MPSRLRSFSFLKPAFDLAVALRLILLGSLLLLLTGCGIEDLLIGAVLVRCMTGESAQNPCQKPELKEPAPRLPVEPSPPPGRTPAELFRAGARAYREFRFAEAEQVFTEALNLQPGGIEAELRLYRGACRFQLGRTDDARRDLTTAIRLGAKPEDGFFPRGYLALAQKGASR